MNRAILGMFSWMMLAQTSTVSVEGIPTSLTEIAARYGLPMAGLIFFIYWAWKREGAMAIRISKVEDDRVQTLKDTIAKCTEAMNRMTDQLSKLSCFDCEHGHDHKQNP